MKWPVRWTAIRVVSHVSGPPQILPGVWQFMEDHPFKVAKQPYPPLPSVYPSYCKIGPVAAM